MWPRSDGHIRIPKIWQEMDLSDYAEELPAIFVWVNPPRALLQEYWKLNAAGGVMEPLLERGTPRLLRFLKRTLRRMQLPDHERRIVAWYARLWSPSGNGHFEERQVVDFALELMDADPALWGFMTRRTWRMLDDHRTESKKG